MGKNSGFVLGFLSGASLTIAVFVGWLKYEASPARMLQKILRERGSMENGEAYQMYLAYRIVDSGDPGLDAVLESLRKNPWGSRSVVSAGDVLGLFGEKGAPGLWQAMHECRQHGNPNARECRSLAEAGIWFLRDLNYVDDWIRYHKIDSSYSFTEFVSPGIRRLLKGGPFDTPPIATKDGRDIEPEFVAWWAMHKDEAIKWAREHPHVPRRPRYRD